MILLNGQVLEPQYSVETEATPFVEVIPLEGEVPVIVAPQIAAWLTQRVGVGRFARVERLEPGMLVEMIDGRRQAQFVTG